jgi:hypothetical protein
MRIVVDHQSEVAIRAGRILLGERSLEALGVLGKEPGRGDERLVRVDDLADFDVIVTDSVDDIPVIVESALEARIGCVLWADGEEAAEAYGERFVEELQTLLVGANLGSGIAPSLAAHERARSAEILDVTVAWTEPGRPLRRGEPIPFPDPVGPRWARERSHVGKQRTFVAPVADNWAAALAKVTGSSGDGVHTRLVGVSDLALHLEALAVAAGAVAVAQGVYTPGAHRPADAAEDYLARALAAGLEVAAYVLD